MKENFQTPIAWNAEADRRFATSPLGRELSKLLHSGSTSQRALSGFVLRDPMFVATHGIEDLAAATSTSASSVSRYVRDLGLAGFSEFRSSIAALVSELIAPVAKLDASIRDLDKRNQGVELSIEVTGSNIDALKSPQTAEYIRLACGDMKAARRVFVIGFGLSAHLAAILVLSLQPYRDEVINVAQYGGTESAAARAMSIGEGDLLVAISFPRYSRDVVEIVRYARDNKARIVAITDSPAAPLAPLADRLLLAPSRHPVLSASNVPAMAIIEALASDFMLADPENVRRAEKLAKAISSYLTEGD
ncbi:MurR/RpiR family transcriptional regulator [Ensifer sp. HO-A22]|uniref:MurR/RpiR family transcriptional regulator n=1 Tax=Ensifer oleiphilus TaxID=2742698 RepID=A0A7Y6QAS6_9HYPH|nr:MurR/RpiR family transcriptional regulator [Ensifer oleiphilus]NVD41950.1 MurR/RpiR family transcriptional regulator [Ensifer oleiphilus]